ncbi:hypothetical protein [Delftia acidovorans]
MGQQLPIIERLQGVLIENRPAIEFMKQHDTQDTQHFVLLAMLRGLRGMVVLSGYPS